MPLRPAPRATERRGRRRLEHVAAAALLIGSLVAAIGSLAPATATAALAAGHADRGHVHRHLVTRVHGRARGHRHAHVDARSHGHHGGALLGDPAASITPDAAFDQLCLTRGHALACDVVALRWINVGRAREHLAPMVPPGALPSWSTTRQLQWVTNAERAARRLPSLPDRAPLDHLALVGAMEGRDPSGPANATWGSNISWGYTTALAADFGWMYDDGPRSPNIDCASAGAVGCWGHRANVLATWPGYQGAAAYSAGGILEMTELFVQR